MDDQSQGNSQLASASRSRNTGERRAGALPRLRNVLWASACLTGAACGGKGATGGPADARINVCDGTNTDAPEAEDLPAHSSIAPPEWPQAPAWKAVSCNGSSVVCVSAGFDGGGGTAEAPLATIQAAINLVEPGGTVLVAAGEYNESLEIADKAVALYGGFSAVDQFQSRDIAGNASVVQAGGQGPAVKIGAAGSRVDGFKLTGGSGFCSQYACTGGAVHVEFYTDGMAEIANNEITGNIVNHEEHNGARGGGIYASAKSIISGNFIHHNLAERGAAVMMEGGTLLNNRIEDNMARGDHAGGIAAFGKGNVMRGNYVARNELGRELGYGWGGGVLVAGEGADLVSEGNVYYDNFATSGGSGVFIDDGASATLRNDLFVGNRCGFKGAAALAVDSFDESGDNGSIVDVQFTTIAHQNCEGSENGGNAVWAQGAGTLVTLRDSIIWGNPESAFSLQTAAAIRAENSIIQDDIPGENNLSEDPLFASVAKGDFHLKATNGRYLGEQEPYCDTVTSPGVDRAHPESAYDKEPAPNGGRANLGAYGNTPQASRSE